MNNPFLSYLEKEKTEYLTDLCSLNKAVLGKLPLYGIEDEIEGLSFRKIFSTQSVVDEIKLVAKKYSIDISSVDDYALPTLLDKALVSTDIKYNQLGENIAAKFGDRLGLLLLALKLGEKENRDCRPEWSDKHWEYWANLDTVILIGGLASSMLGRKLKERIQHIFDKASVKPYNIMLFDNGRFVGVMGCAQLIKDNKSTLVFDFGHTNLKRCIIKKDDSQISQFTALESVPSKYVHSKLAENEDKWETALELHKHLVKTIIDTYRENQHKFDLSSDIIISIANYNAAGELNSERGGYAKLTELGNDYAKIITEDLSSYLHKRVRVKLVHDGTANALYFSEVENAVCVSLGTAFGVGFTDIKLNYD